MLISNNYKGEKMDDQYKEYISVEHLKNILTNLSPEDIVRPAYEQWIPCQRSGYTILNLEIGRIQSLGVEPNQLPLIDITYIELYSIEAEEHPVKPEELFSPQEYDDYMEYKDNETAEYTPDIVSAFCEEVGIDEKQRKVAILADRFEEKEFWNYNSWESEILNEYYDILQQKYSYYDRVDEEV